MRFTWARFWVFWVLAVLPAAFACLALVLGAVADIDTHQREIADLQAAWDAQETQGRGGTMLARHTLVEAFEHERADSMRQVLLFSALAVGLLLSPGLVWAWRRWGARSTRRHPRRSARGAVPSSR